jgi:RNA polymerase sigma-70 factor (sigma-E family)
VVLADGPEGEAPLRMKSYDAEFDTFVAAAWPRLRQAAFALTGNTPDAEDLLQAVLVRAYAAWPRIRRDDPVAYVRRGLVNGYIDTWRRRQRLRLEPVEEVPDVTYDLDAGADERVDLRATLAALTPRERTMVVMRYYLDQPEAEVALALGCSTGTVKSTCSRAVARLRMCDDSPRGTTR